MATQQDGGLWRPANGTEGAEFEAKWCAHCLNSIPEFWEDEFGDDVAGGCAILDQAVWGHQPDEWVVRHGVPWCKAFRQDPDRPARCLFTKEMQL
ncbi:hypothetical protein [Rhizobium rhizogenes]|uniref:hypothetical protein n=1 Tax=Rhizobium rhizogenes TaxID=359 RepID=UPI0015741817|nr:hypothetical protein [Rhizobium rhizogenes]NTF69406.1 hypothetical protein [Rhizobium rhizogenes]